MGIPGPTVGRVRADVEGDGDEVPDLDIEDFVSVLKALEGVGADTEMTMDDLRRVVEGGLEREAERRAQCATGEDEGEAERVGVAVDVDAELSEVAEALILPGSVVEGGHANMGLCEPVGVSRGMVARMAQELVEDGVVARVEGMEELVCGVCEGPVKYRMATAKCAAKVVEVKRRRDRRHRRERLEGEGDGVGAESRIFEERNAKVTKQSDLENMFSDFFGQIVKEWNPCSRTLGPVGTCGTQRLARMTWSW
jgi:hypothetical protein